MHNREKPTRNIIELVPSPPSSIHFAWGVGASLCDDPISPITSSGTLSCSRWHGNLKIEKKNTHTKLLNALINDWKMCGRYNFPSLARNMCVLGSEHARSSTRAGYRNLKQSDPWKFRNGVLARCGWDGFRLSDVLLLARCVLTQTRPGSLVALWEIN